MMVKLLITERRKLWSRRQNTILAQLHAMRIEWQIPRTNKSRRELCWGWIVKSRMMSQVFAVHIPFNSGVLQKPAGNIVSCFISNKRLMRYMIATLQSYSLTSNFEALKYASLYLWMILLFCFVQEDIPHFVSSNLGARNSGSCFMTLETRCMWRPTFHLQLKQGNKTYAAS